MYGNVGRKIMRLARVLGWIFLGAGIMTACVLASYHLKFYIVIIPLITGPLLFLSSWILYGFGQLVDDVHVMRNAPMETEKGAVSDELPEI